MEGEAVSGDKEWSIELVSSVKQWRVFLEQLENPDWITLTKATLREKIRAGEYLIQALSNESGTTREPDTQRDAEVTHEPLTHGAP